MKDRFYSPLHAVLRRSRNRKQHATRSGQELRLPLHLRPIFNTQVQQNGLSLTTPGTTTSRRSWRPARPVSESTVLGDGACCPTGDRPTRMLYILVLAFRVAVDRNNFLECRRSWIGPGLAWPSKHPRRAWKPALEYKTHSSKPSPAGQTHTFHHRAKIDSENRSCGHPVRRAFGHSSHHRCTCG